MTTTYKVEEQDKKDLNNLELSLDCLKADKKVTSGCTSIEQNTEKIKCDDQEKNTA